MKIPKTVVIGGHRLAVKFSKEIEDCGKFDREKGTITIASSMTPSQQEVTFWHEVLHVMNSQLSEEMVDFLAESIYAFLVKNKLCENQTRSGATGHTLSKRGTASARSRRKAHGRRKVG